MPKYLIEREIPGAGQMSPQQLQAVAEKSCSVLGKLGPQIQWVQSYVTDNKVYCAGRLPGQSHIADQCGDRSRNVGEKLGGRDLEVKVEIGTSPSLFFCPFSASVHSAGR
jgi:hypothetical protein